MARDDGRTFVSGRELAQFFNLTPDRVRQLTKDGMPAEARDKYDFVAAVRWYIRFLQEANKRRTQPGDVGGADSLRKERATVLKLQSERESLALARERGEVVQVADAVKEFEDMMGLIRAKLLGAVNRGGLRIMGVRTQAQANAIVEEMIHEALTAAAHEGTNGKNGDRTP